MPQRLVTFQTRAATPTAAGTGHRDDHGHRSGSSTPSAPRPTRSPTQSRRVGGRSPPPQSASVSSSSAETRVHRPGPFHEQLHRRRRRPGLDIQATEPATDAPPDPQPFPRLVAITFTVADEPGSPRPDRRRRRARARSCRTRPTAVARPTPAPRSPSPSYPACAVIPNADATASGTAAGSPTGANSTNHTPSPKSGTNSAATWTARRVLPTPPTPVNVTNRCCAHQLQPVRPPRRHARRNSSSARGRFPGTASTVRNGGNVAARPSARTWNRCSTPDRSRSRCSPRSTRSTPADAARPSTRSPGSGRRARPPSPAPPGSTPARNSHPRAARPHPSRHPSAPATPATAAPRPRHPPRPSRRERRTHPVTGVLEQPPAVPSIAERSTSSCAANADPHPIGIRLPPTRRTLDISEQKRHRPRRPHTVTTRSHAALFHAPTHDSFPPHTTTPDNPDPLSPTTDISTLTSRPILLACSRRTHSTLPDMCGAIDDTTRHSRRCVGDLPA